MWAQEYRDTTLPMVQAGLLGPTFDYAEQQGENSELLRLKARLPDEVLRRPADFVPVQGWFRLLTDLGGAIGRPDVGWQIACANPFKGYSRELLEGIFGAPTLLQALRFVASHQARHCNCQKFQVRVIGNFGYVFHCDDWRIPGYEQRSGFRAASTLLTIRAFLGDRWRPDLIVTDTPLEVFPDCEMLEGTEFVRSDNHAAIRVPRALLAARPQLRYRGIYAGGDGLEESDTANQIRYLLTGYKLAEMPTLAELAEMMRTSERTLQRRLKALDTSYVRLVQEVVEDSNFNRDIRPVV